MASEKTTPQLLALKPLVQSATPAPSDKDTGVIKRRDANELSYNEFYWQYMHANWPLIITNVSNNWECRHWANGHIHGDANIQGNNNNDDANANISTETSPTHINFDYLKSRIGDCMVPVADCNATYFNSHAKLELKFYDFLARWQRKIREQQQQQQQRELNSNIDTDNLYLKDWHLAAQMPTYAFYSVPKYFASDWLNEQLVAEARDDYRFVYMGPQHSWTSYHADVLGSYSWSTNIVGRKKWLIMPPGEELKLTDRLGNVPFSINEKKLQEHKVRFYTIAQSANEAVFVPSGWFHQVWNETDTISVNHNWFNACNAPLVWRNLQTNMQAVRAEIADCRQMDNFESHCQTMLRASFGINYLDFIELLEFIAARRLAALSNSTDANNFLLFDTFLMNEYHVRHDLDCVRCLLVAMLADETVQAASTQLRSRCVLLHEQLKQCANEPVKMEA